MSAAWVGFIVGGFMGTVVGVVLMALMFVAGQRSREDERCEYSQQQPQ